MLAWLLWQLEGMERIRAAAGALMDEFGDEAYAEAQAPGTSGQPRRDGGRLETGRLGRRPLDAQARRA